MGLPSSGFRLTLGGGVMIVLGRGSRGGRSSRGGGVGLTWGWGSRGGGVNRIQVAQVSSTMCT